MITLCDLPDEILLEILTQHVLSERDINAFCQTNHRLHTLANRCLYRQNALHNRSSALIWASETGNLATALYALDHGADINIKSLKHYGGTPLMLASEKGHRAIVEFLLSKDANPNATNIFHETALSVAAQSGALDTVELLLDHPGTLLDLPDTSGQTAFWWACCNGHQAVVERLLARPDVDINRPREDGATPLISATGAGHVAVVEALSKDERIDPNRFTEDSKTALMVAALHGCEMIAKLLVHIPSCNIDAEDSEGKKALYYAVRGNSQANVQL
jgi:ankyrin repeat protein